VRSETRNRPAAYPPRMSEATRPFWDGLREERFQTTQYNNCSDITFPPKVVCPNCLSERLSWCPLSGRGTLYSYTKVWAAPAVFGDEVPYTLCIVDLDEGLRVASRLLDNHATPEVGGSVSLVFLHYEDVTLFCFEPDIR
jgi:uncharacterized protein